MKKKGRKRGRADTKIWMKERNTMERKDGKSKGRSERRKEPKAWKGRILLILLWGRILSPIEYWPKSHFPTIKNGPAHGKVTWDENGELKNLIIVETTMVNDNINSTYISRPIIYNSKKHCKKFCASIMD